MLRSSQCEQGLGVSSTGSGVYIDPAGSTTNVRLYVTEEEGSEEKWYLKVDAITREVSLECQSSLDNVSTVKKNIVD